MFPFPNTYPSFQRGEPPFPQRIIDIDALWALVAELEARTVLRGQNIVTQESVSKQQASHTPQQKPLPYTDCPSTLEIKLELS